MVVLDFNDRKVCSFEGIDEEIDLKRLVEQTKVESEVIDFGPDRG